MCARMRGDRSVNVFVCVCVCVCRSVCLCGSVCAFQGGEGHSQDDEHTGYTLGQVNLFRRLTSSGRD